MTSRDYKYYSAKPLREDSGTVTPAFWQTWKNRVVYDRLLLPYALWRYRGQLAKSARLDDHTYTCFLRAPSQLALLAGPIIDFLRPSGRLNITLLACSNGAECYTIAAWLRRYRPTLDFHIHASDLHLEMVNRAAAAEYTPDEVLHSVYMTQAFLNDVFIQKEGSYVVRPEIRDHVSFSEANLLEGDELRAKFGPSPLVIAQNVLFHLSPSDAALAFDNLVSLMTPRAALLIEGMELDERVRLTAKYGLTPFTQNLRQIYEETRVHTPPHWWRVYWGSEPYIPFRRNKMRRYGTAFFRNPHKVSGTAFTP